MSALTKELPIEALEGTLRAIADVYGRDSAAFVELTMEYPPPRGRKR
jgi:hypothetical protein